jgi:hypothetical protein
MFAFGFMEILILMAFGGGGTTTDLVSIIDANAYFKSRHIEISVDKMAELAARDPMDGKTQLAQLLALRTLGTDAVNVKKSQNFAAILKTVEEIADGKKAQDPHGFAAEYARLTAVALGSKAALAPVNNLPDNSARQEALSWFPDSVKLVAAMDLRSATPLTLDSGKPFRDNIPKFVPPEAFEEMFKAAEGMGNIRVDRVAVALTPDLQERGKSRIFLRVSGKGDHKRIGDFIKNADGQITLKEVKTFRGQRITTIEPPNNRGPGMALIGDTDFLFGGLENERGPNLLVVVEQMLAVRSGKEKSVLTGPLAPSLKKLSPQASGIFAGELTEDMRQSLMRGPNAFRVFPKAALAEALRSKGNTELRLLQATLNNEADAKQFVEDTERLKKMGIDSIKELQQNLPPGLPIPRKTFEQVTKLLESIKVEAKGSEVHGKATIGAEALSLFPSLMIFGGGGRAAPGGEAIEKKATEVEKKIEKDIPKEKGRRPEKGVRLDHPRRAQVVAAGPVLRYVNHASGTIYAAL